MKKAKKTAIPSHTEFTDQDGKKWIQTSTEDLFSVKELNEILDSIESDKAEGEIVIAHIDFKKVNREYYDTVQALQAKLKKRTDILKKIILESKTSIDRKNKKLKELIEYIKKLHVLLAYYKLSPEDFEKIKFTPALVTGAPREEAVTEAEPEEVEERRVEYIEAEELVLDESGEPSTLAKR